MRTRSILFGVAWLVLVGMGLVTRAFAGGFDNHNIGTKGLGMSYALVGIADDASAAYYIPSGLIFIDKGVWHGEVYGYLGDVHCEYTANGIKDESTEPFYIPCVFVSRTKEDWAVGLELYVPYAGGGSSYENF